MVRQGRDVLLDIDVQGARLVRAAARGTALAPALVFVFVGAPSLPVIEQRLRGRGSDAEEVIQRRLANARAELAAWREYDYLVVNDALDAAVAETRRHPSGRPLLDRASRSTVDPWLNPPYRLPSSSSA